MKKSLEVILGVLLLSCFAVNGVNAHVQGSMRALRLEGGLEWRRWRKGGECK